MSMQEKLKIITQQEGEKLLVFFNGVIDEDARFEEILAGEYKEYQFDFEKLSLINSCGIREWTRFIKRLPPQSSVFYVNCPTEVIEQINMIVDFVNKGSTIKTFYAPYYCPYCQSEKKVLLVGNQVVDKKAPAKQCEQCGGQLEFDALEEQYFSFLK